MHFHSRKCISKCRLGNVGHFVSASMCFNWVYFISAHSHIVWVLQFCDCTRCNNCHWNENVVVLMKSSSLAALKVVKMTTFSAASDENFIKMTTFPFQWLTPSCYKHEEWPTGQLISPMEIWKKNYISHYLNDWCWVRSCEIAHLWMSLDLDDDMLTLVKAMARCCHATSHYLSQYWPRSMSPYGVARQR